MLNKVYIPKSEDTLSDDICYRAKLDTGTYCNYNCSFCYYSDRLDKKDSLELIINRIENLYLRGAKEIELSGGESSIHDNWYDILDYCKLRFAHISTLSNGGLFYYESFLQKSRAAGLKEILFSLHGWDETSHDAMVHHKGAYKKILAAITNSINNNLITRLNCTIQNNFNANKYLESLKQLELNKIKQINFLPLNYWEDANDLQELDYSKISNELMKCIEALQQYDIVLVIRYIPFCFIEEKDMKYLKGTYQHIFDKTDWNILLYHDNNLELTKENMFNQAQINRQYSYSKPISCKGCKYLLQCDGIEKTIKKNPITFPRLGDLIKGMI